MISLATSAAKAASGIAPVPAAPGARQAGESGDFQVLFAVLGASQTGQVQVDEVVIPEDAAPDTEATAAPVRTIGLPASGKELPPELPEIAGALPKAGSVKAALAFDDEDARQDMAEQLQQPDINLPVLPQSPLSVPAESKPSSLPPMPRAAALPAATLKGPQPNGAPSVNEKVVPAENGAAPRPEPFQATVQVSARLELPATAASNAESEPPSYQTETPALPSMPRSPTGLAMPDLPSGAQSVPVASDLSGAQVTVRSGAETAIKLAAVIEQLATAREALSNTGAILSVEHADFGEISLRFDQHRSGHLAVQLMARDPQAQSALAAAVGQQPFSGSPDGQPSGGQSGSGASSNPSGQSANRDSSSGSGSPVGQDRSQPRQDHSRATPRQPAKQAHSGIFA